MEITIQKATREDAPVIALAIAMAIGEESVAEYCGENWLAVLEETARAEDTQYSWRNALVAFVDGAPAGAILDSVSDIVFVICCAIRLLTVLEIPVWLWIWAGIIVIIKIVNQIMALTYIKRLCFPHTVANKLTGFLLFLAVPTIGRCIIPIATVAVIATFAAIQEGAYIVIRREIL